MSKKGTWDSSNWNKRTISYMTFNSRNNIWKVIRRKMNWFCVFVCMNRLIVSKSCIIFTAVTLPHSGTIEKFGVRRCMGTILLCAPVAASWTMHVWKWDIIHAWSIWRMGHASMPEREIRIWIFEWSGVFRGALGHGPPLAKKFSP